MWPVHSSQVIAKANRLHLTSVLNWFQLQAIGPGGGMPAQERKGMLWSPEGLRVAF